MPGLTRRDCLIVAACSIAILFLSLPWVSGSDPWMSVPAIGRASLVALMAALLSLLMRSRANRRALAAQARPAQPSKTSKRKLAVSILMIVVCGTSAYSKLREMTKEEDGPPYNAFVNAHPEAVASMAPYIVSQCFPTSSAMTEPAQGILSSLWADTLVGYAHLDRDKQTVADLVKVHLDRAESELSQSDYDRFLSLLAPASLEGKRDCLYAELGRSIERYEQDAGNWTIRASGI